MVPNAHMTDTSSMGSSSAPAPTGMDMAGLLGMINPALGIASAGVGLFQQYKARKDAKKAAREQAKKDAILNLISVAGGGGVRNINTGGPAPQVDVAGALGQGANIASSMEDRLRRKGLDNLDQEERQVLMDYRKARADFERRRSPSGGKGSGGSSAGDYWKEAVPE